MPRKRSKIDCPICLEHGGALILRSKKRTRTSSKRGNINNKKYFHIKHFDPSAKHKQKICYIGRAGKLAYVALWDRRYDEIYEPNMKCMSLKEYSALDNKIREDLERRRLALLLRMGRPKRFLVHKYIADIINADLEYHKKSGTFLDGQFNDELNRRVDMVLNDILNPN
jgi:hypothetical protein